MPQREDEYIPYHERPLPWGKGKGRPPLAEDMREPGEPGAAGERRRPRGRRTGCATGCGCIVAILIGLSVVAYILVRQAPSMGAFALRVLVRGAISGEIHSHNQPLRVPAEWKEPWQDTTDAYAQAYDDGHVDRAHFMQTLSETFSTIGSGPDLLPRDINALCTRMREVLPSDARAGLPPLPSPPPDIVIEDQASVAAASSEADAAAPALRPETVWQARDLLTPQERDRQFDVRRDLRTVLSRRGGPTNALKLVPERAVIFDFGLGVAPYQALMDDWSVDTPQDSGVEAGAVETYGFASPPSFGFAAPAGTRDAYASVSFTTTAGTLNFWYEFQGRTEEGSLLTVLVDGATRHSDTWPTSDPGGYIQDDWRTVRLDNLDAATPSRVEIRTQITEARTDCRLVLDDFVFAQ